jgi:superfamily II DNA/RNA helicase
MTVASTLPNQQYDQLSLNDIRALVHTAFSKRPCYFQVQIARELLAGKDVINAAATGMGKTLSFWIGLLMWRNFKKLEEPEKIVIVVTPLVVLGTQNANILEKAGLSGVAVDGSNLGDEIIFKVCLYCSERISCALSHHVEN